MLYYKKYIKYKNKYLNLCKQQGGLLNWYDKYLPDPNELYVIYIDNSEHVLSLLKQIYPDKYTQEIDIQSLTWYNSNIFTELLAYIFYYNERYAALFVVSDLLLKDRNNVILKCSHFCLLVKKRYILAYYPHILMPIPITSEVQKDTFVSILVKDATPYLEPSAYEVEKVKNYHVRLLGLLLEMHKSSSNYRLQPVVAVGLHKTDMTLTSFAVKSG